MEGGLVQTRPLLRRAQSLVPLPEGSPTRLLESSPQSIRLMDVRPFAEGREVGVEVAKELKGPMVLAVATELPKLPRGSGHGPRLVVMGSSSPVWARSWRDPAWAGNRQLVENALSWLIARPLLVSVPDKPSTSLGVTLTAEAMAEVQRYVLLWMPGSAAALGLLVLLRRRHVEHRARQASHGGAGK